MSTQLTLVTLEDLKLALGIADADTSEDDALTLYEAQAAAWVEEQTHRRFQAPEETVEYQDGSGTRLLYLKGHVDGDEAAVTVRERPSVTSDWEDFTDFERRRDVLKRTDGACWSRAAEYELTYDDGYDDVPADIQALVMDLCRVARSNATSTAGLTSRQLDGYKETFDTGVVAAGTSVSPLQKATIDRWRRRYV